MEDPPTKESRTPSLGGANMDTLPHRASTEIQDTKETKKLKEENNDQKREMWDHKYDYFMSILGCTIGLGNIWRFPYLCYKNGGGVFLVAYFFMVFFVGVPLFMLEASMGQFSSTGVITIYRACPALMGTSITSILASIMIRAYYSVLVTYPLLFLYYSFASDVPWGSCDNEWNTPECYLIKSRDAEIFANATDNGKELVSSADEFFHRKILNISSGIGENGSIVWPIFWTNVFVWIITFLCIFKGIKIAGKVVWFTALFPVLMLFILLVRGVTLPGAADGLYYYLYPDFNKLWEGKVWAAAANQMFYSLGLGLAWNIIMGSYNKFRNNCIADAMIIPVMNGAASILAGFVVFSVLGYMAHEMGTSIDNVTGAGPSLVFVTYPEALAMMPMANVWSILFFLMLFFVGLDSLFGALEAMIASILDQFEWMRKWRTLLTVVTCLSMFLIAVASCTQGGIYVLQLMDWYWGTYSPIIVCLMELITFTYMYGAGNTIRDLQMMTQKTVNYVLYFCLIVVTPVTMISMIVNQTINFVPASYRGMPFPEWAQTIGWVIAIVPPCFIPAFTIYYLCTSKGSFKERLISSCSPTAEWGPADPKDKAQWEEYCLMNPMRNRLLHPNFSFNSPASADPEDVPFSNLSGGQPPPSGCDKV